MAILGFFLFSIAFGANPQRVQWQTLHNVARCMVEKPCAPWSEETSKIAMEFVQSGGAKRLETTFDVPEFNERAEAIASQSSLAENVYGAGMKSAELAIFGPIGWFSQHECFEKTCSKPSKIVGHYKNMAQTNMESIGCYGTEKEGWLCIYIFGSAEDPPSGPTRTRTECEALVASTPECSATADPNSNGGSSGVTGKSGSGNDGASDAAADGSEGDSGGSGTFMIVGFIAAACIAVCVAIACWVSAKTKSASKPTHPTTANASKPRRAAVASSRGRRSTHARPSNRR